MSFFDLVETYLNKNGIELTEQDFTPFGRLAVNDKDEIIKWDFADVKQPTNEDIKQLQEDEDEKEKTKQRKQQQQLQRKLKTLKIPAINSNDLKIKDLDDFDECLFFNISTKKLNYILNGKVNILF